MKQKELTKTFIIKLEDKYFSVLRVNTPVSFYFCVGGDCKPLRGELRFVLVACVEVHFTEINSYYFASCRFLFISIWLHVFPHNCDTIKENTCI